MSELNDRAIKANSFDNELENKELYFLGEYHDTTAEMKILEKEYLLTFPTLIKGGKKHEDQ